ncbi:MAG: OstA-like protein, partial [Bacteroidaceae bacterium]
MFESVKMDENVHSDIQDGLNKNGQKKSTLNLFNSVMMHPWMLGVLLLFVGIPTAMGHRMFANNSLISSIVADSILKKGSTVAADSIPIDSTRLVKRRTRIDLIHADSAIADKVRFPNAQLLLGHVKLKHESMYMYCDSAFIYQDKNSFEAFSNVRCEQGDTLFIYGDYLYYDGEAQLARLRDNVRMINGHTTLTTDSLNYDRLFHLGYYFDGGTLTDDKNTLVSDWGEYSPDTKWAVFNHDVELHNDQLHLYSDTLKYNTDNKEALILGPSTIDSKTNHIYSEKGIYYTAQGQAELLDRSVLTNGSKRMVG